MRLHIDTSFLVDWQWEDPRIYALQLEMLTGAHEVSYDPIVETEYFAVQNITRKLLTTFVSMQTIARRVEVSTEAARLAAEWLAPMDDKQRKAHFADALISAIALTEGAILVTGDTILPTVFPVAVLQY